MAALARRRIRYSGKRAPSNPRSLGDTPITKGVIGCWPGWSDLGPNDTVSGDTVRDVSTRRNHLTVTGTGNKIGYLVGRPLAYELGLPATIDWDAVSNAQFLISEAGTELECAGDVSFAFWFVLESLTSDVLVTYSGGGGSTGNDLYRLDIVSTGVLRYIHEYGSGTKEIIDSVNTVAADTPYHAVVTRNATNKSLKLFVNGEAWIDTTYVNAPAGGSISRLAWGGFFGSTTVSPSAQMAFLTVWDRALSDGEAMSLYHAPTRWRLFERGRDLYVGTPGAGGIAGLLSAAVNVGGGFTGIGTQFGAVTASVSVAAVMSGPQSVDAAWSAGSQFSSAVSAFATATVALIAGLNAGQAWASTAQQFANMTGPVSAGETFLAGANTSDSLAAGAGLGSAVSTGSDTDAAWSAAVAVDEAISRDIVLEAVLQTGHQAAAAYAAGVQAAASLLAPVSASDIAAAIATAVASLSAAVALTEVHAAAVNVFGVGDAVFATVSVRPGVSVTVRVRPGVSATARIN